MVKKREATMKNDEKERKKMKPDEKEKNNEKG